MEQAGIDSLHFDVEDGIFTRRMMLGTRIIGQLRPLTHLPPYVHLCVREPERWLEEMADQGADLISVHLEACQYPHRALCLIRDLGLRTCLALNPLTPEPDLDYLGPLVDQIPILATAPNYPDAAFQPPILRKIEGGHPSFHADRVVDGGIGANNAADAVRMGATGLVVEKAIFEGGTIIENVVKLRAQMVGRAASGSKARSRARGGYS